MKEISKKDFDKIIAQAKKTKTAEEMRDFKQKMSKAHKEQKFAVVQDSPKAEGMKSKGYTEKVDEKKAYKGNFKAERYKPSKQPVVSGSQFKDKLERIKKIRALKKGLKAIPLVGTIASLATSEDASAALPILGAADEAGRGSDKPNTMTQEEQNEASKQFQKEAAERLKKKKDKRSLIQKLKDSLSK